MNEDFIHWFNNIWLLNQNSITPDMISEASVLLDDDSLGCSNKWEFARAVAVINQRGVEGTVKTIDNAQTEVQDERSIESDVVVEPEVIHTPAAPKKKKQI